LNYLQSEPTEPTEPTESKTGLVFSDRRDKFRSVNSILISDRTESKMKASQIFVTVFTVILVSLGIHPEMARADLSGGANIQIDRSPSNDSDESTNDRARSMEFIQRGLAAYQRGDRQVELKFYQMAIISDSKNGWGYLLYGITTDDTTEIVPYLEYAVELFEADGDLLGLAKAKTALELAR
jgi:hypothetical protein